MRFLTLLTLLLGACGGSGQGAQHLTTTPEGVTFAVPAGFSYEVKKEGTSRAYVMKNGSAGVVLAVFPFAAGTVQPTFVTARGLPGWSEEQQVQGGSRAAVIVGGGLLGVGVITAVGDGGALQLARAVADTVLVPISPVSRNGNAAAAPSTDERFFGCFSRGSSFMEVSSASSICLHDDGTFRYRSAIRVGTYDPYGQKDVTSSAFGDGDDSGKWWVEPVELGDNKQHWNLHLIFDDGQESTWEVRFYNGDLVRGDTEIWERT
jgi:hypothetical protein